MLTRKRPKFGRLYAGVDLAPVLELRVHALGETAAGDRIHVVGGDHAEIPLRHQAPVNAQDHRRSSALR